MSAFSVSKGLRDGSSLLALSTVALIAAQPAHAAASKGIYGGGSTLASLVLRQVGDCYLGATVTGDGYSFSAGFNSATPTPALLPNTCTTSQYLLLYGGVGSGAGLRGYVTNDPKQLFRGSVTTTTAAQTVQLPADPPKYIESAGPAPFNAYPYPSVDFGASDSPLPSALVSTTGTASVFAYNVSPASNWQSAASVTVTRANTTSTVTYDAAKLGKPIQLPLFEAPVAVAVNLPVVTNGVKTVNGVKWTIKSQVSATAPGGRIQLSTAQVCAIFSGLVTNWNSTATIPYLKANGTVGTESFAAANTWFAGAGAGTGGGTPYASVSRPITVVFRSDGSGTSYIFTNYLKTVCPLLDPSDTYGYKSIFSTTALPDNSFQKLVDKVTTKRGSAPNWIGASGSDAVAAAIGNDPANHGRIGYLSNDFVAPYNPVTATRPHAARVQNDYLRSVGVYHPGQTGAGAVRNFVAATPYNADQAWASLAANGVTPSSSWTYNDYNVYAKAFPATTYLPGSGTSVNITGLSILPLAQAAYAYPAVGTAYAFLYSCYGPGSLGYATTRVVTLKAFFNWFYSNTRARNIVVNNGFQALSSSWMNNLRAQYLQGSTSTTITAYNALSKTGGCTGVTTGAK